MSYDARKQAMDSRITESVETELYINSFDIEDKSIDFNTINTYKNREDVLDERQMKYISDIVEDVQSEWYEDVYEPLEDATYNRTIPFEKIIVSDFIPFHMYRAGNIVIYNSEYYMCTEDNSCSAPFEECWTKLKLKGEIGKPLYVYDSISMKFKGMYNWEPTELSKGDIIALGVYAGTTLYIAKEDCVVSGDISDDTSLELMTTIENPKLEVLENMPSLPCGYPFIFREGDVAKFIDGEHSTDDNIIYMNPYTTITNIVYEDDSYVYDDLRTLKNMLERGGIIE